MNSILICQSGYYGRIPAYEIYTPDCFAREVLASGQVEKLEKTMKDGLYNNALEFLEEGITSVAEIQRVFGVHKK